MALDPRRLAGVASVAIDGTAYDLVGDLTWSPSTRKRTTLTGMDRVHGYAEQVVAGYIAMKLRDNGARAAQTFQGMVNVTVVVNLANGKQVSGSGMWNVEAVEVEAMEATFAVRFEGNDVAEVLAAAA